MYQQPRLMAGRVVKGEFRLLAILCVVVGILLLLEQFHVLSGVHRLWPVFPAVVGAGLLVLFYQRGQQDLVLMGIGSFMIGVSSLFFLCNFTSWAILLDAWPAFIILVGLSSVAASFYAKRVRSAMWISGGSLVLLGLVFFVVFGVHPGLWPVSLISFGIWILALTRAVRRAR
ncbi:MAG: hypothetical protein JRG91_17775 [Deltaproteobacteria bacterium]|nr:hypothetical protein [Deltaproteobacteria bacterium]